MIAEMGSHKALCGYSTNKGRDGRGIGGDMGR